MFLTVENAMSVYPFSEAKLVAGHSGINRMLKSVNIIDAPDFDSWAKEGDMFFTTAYVFKDRIEDAIQTIRTLKKRGSAGLGIKLGRFWSEMPPELIDEANRLGFPLIELPYPFAFSDQIDGLLKAEITRSTSILQTVVEKQKRLMQLALQQNNRGNPFEQISLVIGCPMVVVGGRGHILYNDTSLSTVDLMKDWPWEPQVFRMYKEDAVLLRIPLSYQNGIIGFGLFVLSPMQLDKTEENLFHQASEMLAYYLGNMYQNGADSFLHQELGLMINRYLRAGTPIETVVQYADKAGVYVFDDLFVCILCALPNGSEMREERIDAIRQEMEFNPAIKLKKGYHLSVDEGIFSIFPIFGTGDVTEIVSMLQNCFLFRDFGQPSFAISSGKDRPERLLEAYNECRETLKLGARLQLKEKILQFETIQLAHLFQFVPDDSMLQYCLRVLGPILESPTSYSYEMLLTLEAYVTNDANLVETAKQLFVHRNTVTYRLEKMNEILGVDFKKTNDMLKLRLAFLFLQLLRKEDTSEGFSGLGFFK
ncbi:PucR family transcriptional regulator [Paenibacillus ihuae]|uniref:PucR family transcriptional regulator n=1 Tax=Paenibacillus ihuae TaxID=1232431 RepID=UPI0006D5474D|nr:PucR family transcriptional regulator [Paenibacillus ihuae]